MSFEGYYECVCFYGHRFGRSLYGAEKCPCGSGAAWENLVDDTNGEAAGEKSDAFWERLLIKPAEQERCNLGHLHTVTEAVYRIPRAGHDY